MSLILAWMAWVQTYQSLLSELRQISVLGSIGAVLGWDERTMMPAKGTELRAQQSALLGALVHQRFVSRQIGDWLTELETVELDEDAAVNVRETRRAYDRAVKIPASLVAEQMHTAVLAEQVWADARSKSQFSIFEPWLRKTLDLKLQEARCVGYVAHPYDALLDEFEPGDTTADLKLVFESLREPLVELIGQIRDSGKRPPVDILCRHFPAAGQENLARLAAASVGFDFKAGRLDISVHPFCSGIGPGDTRMTTRYDEHYFGDAFFGVLHEAGHGLYNQGLPSDHFGTPLGSYISLGIHESQSRMWENLVGRSRSFWDYFLPSARTIFPDVLSNVSADDWYSAINEVRPSLIRVEADETTYNLHILLRFELEHAMVSGDLSIADLPAAWNERMKKYFGITPPDDATGVLQDVHWAGGAIGYFPTYTLGNLYSAQLFEQARLDLGDLDAQFAGGHFLPLLDWLRKNVHAHGKRFMARQLVKRVTGSELSAEPLLRHLRGKAREIYGVK